MKTSQELDRMAKEADAVNKALDALDEMIAAELKTAAKVAHDRRTFA